MKTKDLNKQTLTEIVNHAVTGIRDRKGSNIYGCDLHNSLFNEDYFIIGYAAAEKWLKNNPGIFKAMEEIKEYEQDNFGQVSTDLSDSERVCNMYTYIAGETVLSESKTLQDNWDSYLTDEQMDAIIEELEGLI